MNVNTICSLLEEKEGETYGDECLLAAAFKKFPTARGEEKRVESEGGKRPCLQENGGGGL